MKLDENVHLSSYRADWIEIYDEAKQQLFHVFSDKAIEIEHIGSTSIRGMVAKPIIDIMIGLIILEIDELLEKNLAKLGYEGFGEAGVPGRLYYRKRNNKDINLQITLWGSQLWNDNLLFRDYLRSHPDEAIHYSRFKQLTINKGINTLLKYSDEKSKVMDEIMNNAREWNRRGRNFA
ncbi:GrpB family protein [Bacillus sp. JCM 19034]|uniref:GrpB family protein n=1 Tax=Bacillus sp. JCM 19034 TaxID=1481928 RepID=UPI00078362C0|nr:GrpB family protein [Bacillus sp. JCM 19034]